MSLPQAADEVLTVETREAFPSQFLMKIESASLFLNGTDKHESMEFTASDYKWRLIIYPNGNKTENGEDYISVSLAVADTASLPANWEVNAVFCILLYNQILDNYLCVQGKVRRFHTLKPEWGFSKFISRKTLKEPSNGYVVNDTCVFGAEVFITKSERVMECLTMREDTKPILRTFKISNFSKLDNTWYSEEFTAGAHRWKLVLYPKGNGRGDGCSASIFLSCVVAPKQKVKADYTIRIKDQISGKNCENKDGPQWFTASAPSWGWHGFISLADLDDATKGFLVKDCCVLEVEVLVLATTREVP